MSLYRRYAASQSAPGPAEFSNFLGLVTQCKLFGMGDRLAGAFVAADPIPDDGVYGSANEYASVLEAVARAQEMGRTSFSMIELGSGWGPWISAAGLVCKREGFTDVKLVGVEADPVRYASMLEHFARNALTTLPLTPRFLEGAVWDEETTLFFPKAGLGDHGGAANVDGSEYRGKGVEMQEVRAWTLDQAAEGLGIVDLIHWDIQGSEARVAEANVGLLNERVRSVQIGTHSREQEGRLLVLFHSMGWDMLRESPCAFSYRPEIPSIEGMTTTDGELYFRNPVLW